MEDGEELKDFLVDNDTSLVLQGLRLAARIETRISFNALNWRAQFFGVGQRDSCKRG